MTRPEARVVAALLVAYAAFYLCRANVDAAIPLLIRDGYGDKARLGMLSSVAIFVYGVGKFVLGAWGDRLGGRRLMSLAVVGSVACSLAFGASRTFGAFLLFAAANRFFQAGGWPAVVAVVSRRFEPARHGRVMGILSTSYELGNVCALRLSGHVASLGWRALFLVNPILLAVLGGGAVWSLRAVDAGDGRAAAVVPGREPPPDAPSVDEAPEAFRVVLRRVFASRALWTTLVLSALLTFIRTGFLTWTPTYLSELAHAPGGTAIPTSIAKSAIFPAAGVVAALVVGPISDRLGPGRRAPIIALSLAVVVVLVLVLAHVDVRAPVLLIGGIGLFLLGPYSLLAGAIALDVGGRRASATAAGIIDGAGYLAATAAPYVIGRVSERSGWSAGFDVVAAAAGAATLVAAGWAVAVHVRKPASVLGGLS